MMKIKVFTDGGSRGNPGNAGFGVVVIDENSKVIFEGSKNLGIKTNNEAEYEGLIFALNWVKENEVEQEITEVEFMADSELMVKQMQGVYKVKAGNLLGLNQLANSYKSQLNVKYSFYHIRREFNSLADALANKAMDNL